MLQRRVADTFRTKCVGYPPLEHFISSSRLLIDIINLPAVIAILGNYSGLLPTCQRSGNRLQYHHDKRRRTASPSRRKSNPQSVGSGTAAVERASDPGERPDQGARRPIGTKQSNE